ncbi:aminotransferase class III-fold pyridoxal phosphate-dependent enzyme, partial [Dietzia aerolata]
MVDHSPRSGLTAGTQQPAHAQAAASLTERAPLAANALLAADAEHVWHPYGGFPASTQPLPVASAEGARLRLTDGRELIDGMSSWWAAIHGYRHPHLDAA